ncbi:response regulator transcription factor [Sporosarcina limicola]|uniref:Two-component system response regulator YesN n=1 Tax=Sporosarcina limicola TaxID=34101 RepID=A0A927MHE5_9BACL|nr:response regulator [Sporosarcina limicola]MBE1554663.1 two-component system response regulator YesN [Sporosarcina limicola]
MYKLLLVDDEPIIIKGIRSFVDFDALSISDVFEASNGEMALEIFKTHLPDLILADINMPKMNGLDFSISAKTIKPDVKIALITGYDYFDYALTALKQGIDDYVLKPVSRTDIQETLKKLIEKIETNQSNAEVSRLVQQIISTSSTPEDAGYKAKIQNEIDSNLSNVEFSLTYLAKQMALSTSYLSTLFKTLYGTTFQDYMLNTRLDRAKILLLSTEMKIYEIAAAVGFDDPNYFSATFKRKFNFSPNQFKEKARK